MGFWKIVWVGLVLGVAFVATLETSRRLLDRFEVEPRTVGLNLVPQIELELDALRDARTADPAVPRVAFLGDSISINSRGYSKPVPAALRSGLAEQLGGATVAFHSLAALGAGPFDYYYLADEIADSRPHVVVMALSLQSFGKSFRDLSRSRLSGWVSGSRLVPVILGPNHWIGLTADDLLMNVLIVQTGWDESWRRLLVEQSRLGVARDSLATWAGDVLGSGGPRAFELVRFASLRRRGRLPGVDRYDAAAEHTHYGAAIRGLETDHPILTLLGETIGILRAADVEVLVYTNPINLEHLSSLGLPQGDRLARSLATLERTVVASGGHFLDLHALVPEDAAYWDAAGHLGTEQVPEAMQRVADAAAPAVAGLLESDQNWK